MKMFIPEIGTRIVLIEDFYFTHYSNNDAVLEKGLKLSIKKMVIKKGRSHTNHVEVSVLKCKENKNSQFCSSSVEISIYEFNEMVFDLEDCNSDTKDALIKTLEDIQEYTKGLNTYYKILESILLDSKNIISFSPQQSPIVFFRTIVNRIKKREKEYKDFISYEKLYGIVNKYFRKSKIAELLKND